MTPHTKEEIVDVVMGMLTLGYAVYCVARGRIERKTWLREYPPILRSERPLVFWFLIGVIIVVAWAMLFDPQLLLHKLR